MPLHLPETALPASSLESTYGQHSRTFPESCKPHEEDFEVADELLKDGRWTQAEFVIRQIQYESPECPLILLYFGRIHYYQQNDRKALSYFNRLAATYPEIHQTYHFRGLIYHEQGLELVALEEFHKVMITHKTIGTGYFFHTILPILEKGAELNPNRIDSLMQHVTMKPAAELSRGLLAFFREDYDEALEYFENFVAQIPDHAGGWVLVGRCNESLKKEYEALDAYNRAIARSSDFAEAYFYRGLLNIDVENWYGGCIDLHRARSLDNPAAGMAFRNYCR